LGIHGPIDDRQLNKKRKKLPIIPKESFESELSNSGDGYDSKPLSNYMAKASRKAQDGRKDQVEKKGVDNCFTN
jgi:hypothetical protein